MREYGDFTSLSENVEGKIKTVVSKIKEKNIESISVYYGYPIVTLDNAENIMKCCIVSAKGILALCEVEREKIIYKRHLTQIMMVDEALSSLVFSDSNVIECVLFDDDKEIDAFLSRSELMSREQFKAANGIIQNIYGLIKSDDREIHDANSLGALIKKRNNSMSMLDSAQFNTVYNTIRTHSRIRGLAGSGKTILLVKKMAYLHYKNPELELAYVFYTKSLKQYIERLFRDFYHDFDKVKDPDMRKIHILHSWGGSEMAGFLSVTCRENGIVCKSWAEAKNHGGFEYACNDALNVSGGKIAPKYNYIFIDEAQDFCLSFFKLALKTLKYTGKMIYAYDELQSLNENNTMPTKQQIFGDDVCEDINLSVCYRTPMEILVAAHSLGLGIYKRNADGSNGIVNMMEDYTIWNAVGYKIKNGELGYGKYVEMYRDEEIEFKPSDSVRIFKTASEKDQYKSVAEEIFRLLEKEDVSPEDIMIIDLNTLSLQDDYTAFKTSLYNEGNPFQINLNLVNKDNAFAFRKKGSLTYTSIFRAKGNEANIVFVINTQSMSSISSVSRNRIFTAMTRAKFMVYLYGVATGESSVMNSYEAELEAVKLNDYELRFIYPTEKELKEMRSIAKVESEKYDNINKASRVLGNDIESTLEILKAQLKIESEDELIEYLKRKSED